MVVVFKQLEKLSVYNQPQCDNVHDIPQWSYPYPPTREKRIGRENQPCRSSSHKLQGTHDTKRQCQEKNPRATDSHKIPSESRDQDTTPSQSQGHPVLIKKFRPIAQRLTALPETPPTTSLRNTPRNTLHVFVVSTLLPSTPICCATFSVCGPIKSPPPRCHTPTLSSCGPTTLQCDTFVLWSDYTAMRHFVRLHCNAILRSCGLNSVTATIATATATT
ncbi:unnamed protein product, partial [Ectocarpus sp. 8 AP-2014]